MQARARVAGCGLGLQAGARGGATCSCRRMLPSSPSIDGSMSSACTVACCASPRESVSSAAWSSKSVAAWRMAATYDSPTSSSNAHCGLGLG